MIGFVDKWNSYLDKIPADSQDLYFREEYVGLYETENEKPCCFVYQKESDIVLMPFLRRSFTYKGATYYDFETAYGYGGPISNSKDEAFKSSALQAMKTLASENNYVCGFVRFHPLLSNWTGFDGIGRLIKDRKTIAIDLTGGEKGTWEKEIHTKNRNVIRKGEKNGLEFIVDNDFVYLKEFEVLYNSTMKRLGADKFYHFTSHYYDQLQNSLNNRFLGIVKHGNKVIAGAVFFYQKPFGHYHLAGSDITELHLSPNNYLLWGAAKEYIKRGVSLFHLGGGTDGSEENSLYQFKRKFSKSEYDFYLGKIVFNEVVYDELCENWVANNPEKAMQMSNILLKYKY